MSVQKDIRDGKVHANIAGEVLSTTAAESNKVFHVDGDLQVPNRTHKNNINVVSQITDKAHNVALTGECTYDYDKYIEITNVDGVRGVNKKGFKIGLSDFIMFVDFEFINFDERYTYLFGLMNAVNKMAFGLRNGSITTVDQLQLITTTTGGDYRSDTFSYTFSASTRYKIVLIRQNDLLFFIVDNVLINKVFFTNKNLYGADDLLWGFGNSFDAASNEVKVYQTKFFNNQTDDRLTIDSPLFDVYDMSYITDNFKYIKRYPNDGLNKVYFSSKFLKDAIIDVNNKIEKIYNSLSNTFFEQLVLANKPTHTQNGIEFLSGESLTQVSSDEYAYGTGNFYLGQWVNFKNESQVFAIGNDILIGIDATNIYVETSGGKLYANRANAANEGYKYIGFHRENGVTYLTIDGYFENSRTESVNYGNNVAIIGGVFIGTFEDLLSRKEKLITFAGKTQGKKVFEPPYRGGFNSDIKQFS